MINPQSEAWAVSAGLQMKIICNSYKWMVIIKMKSQLTDYFKKLLCVILTSLIIIGMSPIGVFADYYLEQNISFTDLMPPSDGSVIESDANHFFYYRLSNKELYIRLKRNIAVEDDNIIATITASKEGRFPSDVVQSIVTSWFIQYFFL